MSTTLAAVVASLHRLEEQVRDLRTLVEQACVEAETASAPSGSAAPASSSVTPEWLASLAAATSREELAQLDLQPLADLVRESRISDSGVWTAELRVARAFRSGYLGRCAINLDQTEVPDPIAFQLPSSLRLHVVLRCPAYPNGFWSEKSRPFLELVGNPTGKYPASPPTSVFGSFYSKSEAKAYLRGAGRIGWPPQL